MKVAIAQINPIIADIEGNKKKILDYIFLVGNCGLAWARIN